MGFSGNTSAWAASSDAICISTSAAPDKGLKVGLLDCDMTVENRCGEMYRCDRSKFASGSGSETGRNPALYSTVLAWRYVRPIGTSIYRGGIKLV